ncbi:hypothetical protein LTR70_000759 [Exophiala xenobiotica]|uniref:Nephrocystin 3-like N-terminal domain-containing protein n=1 Tax=Lithohypha guttulata TaxID=1690604 RepID=A0ABR0KN85_9EURO|nr:hypothetical protein LTR24_000569 [Lithohypha guttulata]KAK5329262.1 hypothetical protein LTR70_000759 [Exophiala xenobiotica]
MSDSSRTGHIYGDISAEQSRMLLGDDLSTHNNSFVFNVAGASISEVDRKAATLAALAYHDMNAKRNRLAAKLAETKAEHFEWIWDVRVPGLGNDEDIIDPTRAIWSRKDLPGFVSWLASESPIFWISGKPASGKSTLMKFISGNKRCVEILESATGRQWHRIDFFFDYRLHKHEANTVEGMFKSLLSQLIERSSAISQHIASSSFGRSLHVPYHEVSLDELRKEIGSAIASTDCHVCIFVDGLDEFEGSFRLLIGYLKSLADATPSIRMQDYNISTIRAYVKDSLSEYAHYLPEAILQRLIDRIGQDSDGVISWSRLVCGDVVKGMLACETEAELHERISTFPEELHEVYERLFQQMDPRYTPEAVLILHLVEAHLSGSVFITVLQRMLEWLVDQRLLVSYPSQYLTRRSFIARLEARLGGLIDVVPDSTIYADHDLHVQIIHKTLSSYLENSSILTANLPTEFITSYPNYVWDRLHAAFIHNSRIFDTWPSEEVLQMSFECYDIVRADDSIVDQDVSSVNGLAAKGWTRSQVSLAKECVMLFEATDIFEWDPVYSEELQKALWYSVAYSDAMCLHLLAAARLSYCCCGWVPALKPSEPKLAFLRLPAYQRAFWFSLVHKQFDEADRLLSSLDSPSELVLTLCHELYQKIQERQKAGVYVGLHSAGKIDVIEKLFQHWRPEWCEPDSNDSASDAHHSAIIEVGDTNSNSGIQEEDNDAEPSSEDDDDEDDDDGGVLCPSTP